MPRIPPLMLLVIQVLATVQMGVAEEVLFEESFDSGLSPKWSIVGLKTANQDTDFFGARCTSW